MSTIRVGANQGLSLIAKIFAISRPPRYSPALRASSPLARCSQSTLLLGRHECGVRGHRLPFRLEQREQVQGKLDYKKGFRLNFLSRLLTFRSRLLNGLRRGRRGRGRLWRAILDDACARRAGQEQHQRASSNSFTHLFPPLALMRVDRSLPPEPTSFGGLTVYVKFRHRQGKAYLT